MGKNVRHLRHFHHEGGLAHGKIVRSADARKDAVNNADARGFRGDKAADLRHDDDESDLPF